MEKAQEHINNLNGETLLNLSYLGLTELPDNLPTNLIWLHCDGNLLTEIPRQFTSRFN
jgi:hypothetical protein